MSVSLQGIQMQPDTVTQFQADIFAGRWDAALALLPKLTFDSDVALQASSSPEDKFRAFLAHALLAAKFSILTGLYTVKGHSETGSAYHASLIIVFMPCRRNS
jgi:hypothetical protein